MFTYRTGFNQYRLLHLFAKGNKTNLHTHTLKLFVMFKEEKLIPDFDIQEMLNKVVDKYIAANHVLFETPVYEKVNDELWFIYFTSKHNESSSDWKSKMYYQVVMGFACISDYYFNTDLIDEDKNKPLDDLKIRFRNYIKSLLEKSEELTEADYWDGDETDKINC